MQLETKHLAPYLPYKLICQVKDLGKTTTAELHSIYADGTCTFCDTVESEKGFDYVKLILYPLSDFIKFEGLIEEMSEQEVERLSTYLKLKLIPKGGYVSLLEYSTIIKMFEYHLDIFFLIPKGLAVDKNTLSK